MIMKIGRAIRSTTTMKVIQWMFLVSIYRTPLFILDIYYYCHISICLRTTEVKVCILNEVIELLYLVWVAVSNMYVCMYVNKEVYTIQIAYNWIRI